MIQERNFYVIYAEDTGAISVAYLMPPDMIELQMGGYPGHKYLCVCAESEMNEITPENAGNYRVLEDVMTARPTFAFSDEITLIANGVDTVTLTLPDPCSILVDGVEHTITGGTLPLSSDMPAEYLIEIRQWPYVDKSIKVTANAPV